MFGHAYPQRPPGLPVREQSDLLPEGADLHLLRVAIERLTLHLVGTPPEEWPAELEAARGGEDELRGKVLSQDSPTTTFPESPGFFARAEEVREDLWVKFGREPTPEEVVQGIKEWEKGSLAGDGEEGTGGGEGS